MLSSFTPEALAALPAPETVTLRDTTFSVPPWLTPEEFVAGLKSEDNDNPLARVTKCTFVKWLAPDDDYDEIAPQAIFDVEWLVPYGGAQELIMGVFTPYLSDEQPSDDRELDADPGPIGVTFSHRVGEYVDIHDIQVAVLPRDLTQVVEASYRGYMADYVHDLLDDFDTMKEYAEGWGGFYREIKSSAGEPYFILANVHED